MKNSYMYIYIYNNIYNTYIYIYIYVIKEVGRNKTTLSVLFPVIRFSDPDLLILLKMF